MNAVQFERSASSVPGENREAGRSVIEDYLRILMRRHRLILGVIAAFILASLIITLLMTPQYTATTTIEISRESGQVTKFEGVERETSVADQEFYQTQYGLLQARSLAERVANELALPDNPAFFEMYGEIGAKPELELDNGRFPSSGRAVRQRVAGEILLDHVSIAPLRLSRLVDIGFTSPDPEFSTRVANAWSENFIESNLERKVQSTAYGRNLLEQQLAEFKQKLDESQRQLVDYASNERIINLPAQSGDKDSAERSIVADDLSALNEALGEAIADRIAAQSRLRQANTPAESLQNQAINNLRQRRAELQAEYERMMVQFEPGYPAARAVQSQINELNRAISREEGRVQNSLRSAYNDAKAREDALRARVEGLKSDFLDLRRRSIQYNIYQQEVDTNRVLYDGLLQRFKEIGVAGGVGVNNVAIVDPADVPQEPSSPNILLNLLIAVLGGVLAGAGLAFVLEQMDDAIGDPDEIQRRLGLPLLGTIPRVEDETPREALLDRKSDLVDAYLAIQTNLSFSTDHGVPRSFAITSTRPAEGKSITALALAATLARAGRKVILVDGDMRSPSVHHLGGVGHEMGLSNFLTGHERIEDLTFHMDDLGLTAMSAGPIPPNAAELLTGDRLGVLVERLLETYDHVVIDSPPVMGLADAPLIASRVEGVVYAVESHGIQSRLVATALSRLKKARGAVLGAVLTKFDARKAKYGYGYEYGYGYGRDDEPKPA